MAVAGRLADVQPVGRGRAYLLLAELWRDLGEPPRAQELYELAIECAEAQAPSKYLIAAYRGNELPVAVAIARSISLRKCVPFSSPVASSKYAWCASFRRRWRTFPPTTSRRKSAEASSSELATGNEATATALHVITSARSGSVPRRGDHGRLRALRGPPVC
jgi:hypothetical protein